MLNGLSLPTGQGFDRKFYFAAPVDKSNATRGIRCLIRVTFKCKGRINLTLALTPDAADEVDRPPVCNDGQPGGERTSRIEGLSRPMNGQQDILHHVVNA